MGGYNPTSQAGYDDAVDPTIALAKQKAKDLSYAARGAAHSVVNRRTSGGGFSAPLEKSLFVERMPKPMNLVRLGGATAAGIAAESTAQNALNATRGGEYSDNPYIASLEKLGGRAVGGATTGAIYGKSLPGAVLGTIGGVGYNAAEDLLEIAKTVPKFYRLYKDNQELEEIRLRSEQGRKLGTKTTENKTPKAG